MEATCIRCHQTIQEGATFCPACGLPQLVYTADPAAAPEQGSRWAEVARDASMVDWKPAMRAAFLLAIPAGLLSSSTSPVSFFGIFWMAAAAAWAVALYVRGGQGTAWITIGAGARIGLVTGLAAAWLAFTVSGGALFVQRYMLHHGAQIDGEWKNRVEMSQQMTEQWQAGLASADPGEAKQVRTQVQAWMESPWGHAGIETAGFAMNALLLLLFAAGGGALGARMTARMRRPQL
ncbi:MAG TPA: zinc ribbon domain-containing protein [Terracidiphilus sp.]|nr:zinc ribbon domain-containing protein [Terracidiphilus sp.]